MGIQETKEVVVFLAKLASAADAATRNGLGFDDIGLFITPLMDAPKALEGLDQAKMELADMDDAEVAELNKAVAEALDLADDKVEALVEKGLTCATMLYGMYMDYKNMKEDASE